MQKVTIRPAWQFVGANGELVDPRLFALMRAIRDHGKLTAAAREVRLSYRHAWDLLARWSDFFGSPLVAMTRGKGAQPTLLGAKLLWAEQRTEANLFPHLANIASELNFEIARHLQPAHQVVRVHASHGYAIEKLPVLARAQGACEVELKYMGSADALRSLAHGECDVAGFHLPEGRLARAAWKQYAPWVRPEEQSIVSLVWRTQGLIVAPRNPLHVTALRHLTRRGVRFVNRQKGSGTRLLLDALLKAEHIDADAIRGYHETGEFTHAAVAAFVASGVADAGLGVEPAARQFHLGFVPIARERYLLACRTEAVDQPGVASLLGVIRGAAFAGELAQIAGYEPDDPGRVMTVKDAFPWVRPSAARAT